MHQFYEIGPDSIVPAPEDPENFQALVDITQRFDGSGISDMGIIVVRSAAEGRPMIVVHTQSTSGTMETLGNVVWEVRRKTRCPFWIFDAGSGIAQYIKLHFLDRACVVREVK